MIEALMDSPYYGIADRADLSSETLNKWVTTRKCYLCGEEFTMYCDIDRYCYSVGLRNHNHRRLLFCSWHCLRKFQREHADSVQQEQGRPRDKWRESREKALKRKAYCEKKLRGFEEARDEAQSSYERRLAQSNVYNWRFRLKEVEEFLNGEEGEE